MQVHMLIMVQEINARYPWIISKENPSSFETLGQGKVQEPANQQNQDQLFLGTKLAKGREAGYFLGYSMSDKPRTISKGF